MGDVANQNVNKWHNLVLFTCKSADRKASLSRFATNWGYPMMAEASLPTLCAPSGIQCLDDSCPPLSFLDVYHPICDALMRYVIPNSIVPWY